MHLMHHYLKKRQIEAILRFKNHFYHECFLQYVEGCPRVFSFHLNHLDSEGSNGLQSRCHPPTTANWIMSTLTIGAETCTKAYP